MINISVTMTVPAMVRVRVSVTVRVRVRVNVRVRVRVSVYVRARVRVRVRVRVRMVAMPPASTGEGAEPRSSHSTSTLRGVPSMVPMEMKSGWVSEMPRAMRKLKPRSKSAWLRLG